MASGEPWTRRENVIVVKAYLEMLQAEQSGTPMVKAEVNREIQSQTGRSRGSVEFKMRNISAVLQAMGRDWVAGYRPAQNYQSELAVAVQLLSSGM